MLTNFFQEYRKKFGDSNLVDEEYDEDELDDDDDDDIYDVKGERKKLKSMGLENHSKEGFDRLIQYHEQYKKDEEEKKKKQQDEKRPFLL